MGEQGKGGDGGVATNAKGFQKATWKPTTVAAS